MQNIFCLVIIILSFGKATCQIIYLNNASFEGEPQDATMPVGWFACTEDTTPDILPGPWGVYTEASEGDTFIGLITRENGTWEGLGQRLSEPLRKGECYAFTIDLAHSATYAGYNKPLKLRIWGGRRKCDRTQLLFESPIVEDADWTAFPVSFYADKTLHYISLEAFYQEGSFSYRGNILIDNISAIKRCARAQIMVNERIKN